MFELILIVGFVVALYLAFKLGEFVAIWPIRQMLIRLAKQQGTSLEAWLDEVKDKNPDTVHYPGEEQNMEITSENGVYYAWASNGNLFLGQGKTFDELFSIVKAARPNANFRIGKEQLDKFSETERGELTEAVFRVFK